MESGVNYWRYNMFSLSAIKSMNAEAAEKAEEDGDAPCLLDAGDVYELQDGDYSILKRLPHMGPYLPVGWHRVRLDHHDPNPHGIFMGDNEGCGAYFVDSSGFGRPGEGALTADEFVERVKSGYGYAIVEAGEFQVKIGVFDFYEPGVDRY